MHSKSATTDTTNQAITVENSVLFQAIGGEVVLLDIESGEYYGLNEVGSRIWTLIHEGRTASGILSTMLKEYDVSENVLATDIKQFLLELQAKRIIQLNGSSPTQGK